MTDILEAIAKSQRYVAALTFPEFAADEKTIDAVLRNFAVIGEAANHIPEKVTQANPHVYFGVDLQIIWDTIQDDLPSLVDPLSQLL